MIQREAEHLAEEIRTKCKINDVSAHLFPAQGWGVIIWNGHTIGHKIMSRAEYIKEGCPFACYKLEG